MLSRSLFSALLLTQCLVFQGGFLAVAKEKKPTNQTKSADESKPAESAEEETPQWDIESPPGPGRDQEIDVTEGTWMNLDAALTGGRSFSICWVICI